VAEGQDEETGAAVLSAATIAHHRPFTVVDPRFFTWRAEDDRSGLGRPAVTGSSPASSSSRTPRGISSLSRAMSGGMARPSAGIQSAGSSSAVSSTPRSSTCTGSRERTLTTFWIPFRFRRREESRFGEYRTKRVVLECFDAMQKASEDSESPTRRSSTHPPVTTVLRTRRQAVRLFRTRLALATLLATRSDDTRSGFLRAHVLDVDAAVVGIGRESWRAI
jgi:hypothetical protein